MSAKTSSALAVAILLLAMILRVWSLATLPPGLHPDEIEDIRITETVRQGRVEVFYDLGGVGREGLYGTVESVVTSALGGGLIGYRLLSVWSGLVALTLTYALVKRLYSPVAALAAMALLAVSMWPVLLSRMITRETVLPALTAGVLVALAHALAIPHWRVRRTPITTSFTALGVLLGVGFYIHPVNFGLVLMSMLVIAILVRGTKGMPQRSLGYVAFSIVVLVVISTPYLISSIRLPEFAGSTRVFANFAVSQPGPLRALIDGLGGFIFIGDANPVRNLPERPMIDLISGLFAIIGLLVTIRHWRQRRFMLPLIASLVLAPFALIQQDSPNFLAMSVILPLLALFFGVGVSALWRALPRKSRPFAGVALAGLLIGNLLWTIRDLFFVWPDLPKVEQAYNERLAQVAHYLDVTAGELPTVVCVANLDADKTPTLDTFEVLALMMHRQNAPLRFADCGSGLILANGGEREQIVFPEANRFLSLHREIRTWLMDGQLINGGRIPTQSVVILDVSRRLANTIGRFTTTAPVSFAPEAPGGSEATYPPVRFGGNITFLGYESINDQPYRPGDWVTVITYWRVDGQMPPDLRLFAHVLADPTAIAAQRDTISVLPALLRPRDVFMQITYVQLPRSTPAGEYLVSIGAYEDNTDVRLNVFDGEQPRGTRLFLEGITVETDESDA